MRVLVVLVAVLLAGCAGAARIRIVQGVSCFCGPGAGWSVIETQATIPG